MISEYLKTLKGEEVYFPPRDAPQESKTGYEIVMSELNAIKDCNRVDIFWDVNSKGSHFDLGMAIALGKEIKLVENFGVEGNEKSYLKVMRLYMKDFLDMQQERYNIERQDL